MKRPNCGNRDNCKLYDENGVPIMRLTRQEALTMVARGRIHHVRGGMYKQNVTPSNARETARSITYADVLANVGIMDAPHSTRELSRGRQLAAQAKIAAFGETRLVCRHFTGNGAPIAVHTTVILNVADEVLGFDDSSEPEEISA